MTVARIAACCFALALAGAAPSAAETPAVPVTGGPVALPRPVEFVGDSVVWTPESEAALEHVRDHLRAHPEISLVRVEGHVNGEPEDEQAQRTSELRALAVARWLRSNGIDCLRIIPVGFGAKVPVAARDTREGRLKNSRISFVVVEIRGRRVLTERAGAVVGLEVTGTCD